MAPLRDYISQGSLRRRGPGAARPARGMLGRGLQNGQPQGCARYGPARAAPAAPGSTPAFPGLCSSLPSSLPAPGSAPAPPGLWEPGMGVSAPGWGCAGRAGAGGGPPVKSPPFFPQRNRVASSGWILPSFSFREAGVELWDGCSFNFPPFPTGKPCLGSGMVSPLFYSSFFPPREAESVVRGGSTADFSSFFPTGSQTLHSFFRFP